ncbi:hypothetical protein ASPWEDRAFT_538219 [Aspergillus wentii DTO 134E9]|uniref:Ketoreductase domain-containing protein n=1 Tax=Aspergillus wentii DTO 134E9 TaxID=1073089 RepID=A0A1L9RMT0_ASPWE|nr:uncharacterized protein ASPWEDRAFT_538219 [Aspergillus wentii DTO 134E9]KAI9929302.1 hypothetical protein MW887_000769 [Aspergillus wentii]OJJ36260.1 hypothetical protein ASPWEDRAFT_538219 [Aspergillus wentii DTO 134E9]
MTAQLTWLVTGCSSGLGEAFVHAILNKGDQVIATARPGKDGSGAERLSALKDAGAAVMELDVTAPQEELNQKAQEAWEIYGKVDVLVNNAGYIEAGVLEELDEETLTRCLRVNTLGPLNLTRAFLPLMRARQTGTLLFVGSIGPYFGAHGASSYVGSKGLLEGIVPNLALEVAPFGLRTSILTFGHFRTAVMAPGVIQYRAPRQLPEYAEMNKLISGGCAATNGNQPGDPRKGCELVVDAVRGEGRCAGKELPLRLPIGADALQCIRQSCEERMQICDEWDGIASQTDFDDLTADAK